MRLTSARIIRTIFQNRWILRSHAALVSIAGLAGCNTCVTITSNPPTGTLGIVASNPSPVCTLPKVTGAVRLRLATESACSSCVGSGQIQHIFIAIRGIELNPIAAAGDDSPDWQEMLSPELVQKPLQVDLMEGKDSWDAAKPLGETARFPAGIYRELRLRLVPNPLVADDRLPVGNPCGRGTFNCAVMADRSIHPLQLDAVSPELRITSDGMDGAPLLFPPDSRADLVIELNLVWELSSSGDTGLRLLPALAGSANVSRIKLEEVGTPEDEVANDSPSR